MTRPKEHAQTDQEDSDLRWLATKAARGDDEAFSELYRRLSERVFNLVLRSVHDRPTAEDLSQEIWLRAHHEIHGLREPQAVRAWLYRLASRACIDFSRSSRGKHRGDEDDIGEAVASAALQPEDAAIVDSEVEVVWETLGALPPRQSLALYLRQVAGLTYAEIAHALDCNESTVETLLFRARRSFARAYDRLDSSATERCAMFSHVMAVVLDGELTELQRSGLQAHASACISCRALLLEAKRANRAYRSLPLLPVGNGLVLQTVLGGSSGGVAGSGLLTAAAGLLGAGALPAKVALVGAVLVAVGLAAGGKPALPPGARTPPATRETAAMTSLPVESGLLTAPEGDPQRVSSGRDGIGAATAGMPALDAATAAPAPALGTSNETLMTVESAAELDIQATNPPGHGEPARAPARTPSGPLPAPGDDPDQTTAVLETPGAPDGPGESTASTLLGDIGTAGQGATNHLAETLAGAAGSATGPAGAIVGELPPIIGDTLNAVTAPATTLLQPIDEAVEGATGLSAVETLDDVTGILPSSTATPAPLENTVADVLEPTGELLEDPLQPVETVLEDPLAPVQTLTEPILAPVLAPLSPSPEATAQPETTPEVTPAPDEGSCLLGLLLC